MAKFINLKKGYELNMKLYKGTKFNEIEHDIPAKSNWIYIVGCLLANGQNFGAAQFTGQYAGFTALHYACLDGDFNMVVKLRGKYGVDPMVKACDGVEPIHLAAFLGRFDIVYQILEMGVLNNIKLNYSHLKKYAIKEHKWEPNFRDEMDLFTYGTFNNNNKRSKGLCSITKFFLNYPPPLPIHDIHNKTILLYTIESQEFQLAELILGRMDIKELKQCDKKGVTAFHAIINELLSIKLNDNAQKHNIDKHFCNWMKKFYHAGLNINVVIDSASRTPLHITADHNLFTTLKYLLSKQQLFFSSQTRPLIYYAQRQNYFDKKYSLYNRINSININMLRLFTDDISLRLYFGYPVEKSEKQLIERLWIEKCDNLIIYLNKKATNYSLMLTNIKEKSVIFGHKKMSLYQALMAPQKEFNIVAKRKSYGFKTIDDCDGNQIVLVDLLESRLRATIERMHIFQQWQKIANHLIKSLLLPYDCLWYIATYMDNCDLDNLIKACSNSY
ncbi:hypothetical protein KQX54_008393 [Cotesia glomerata]|uniref:Uncharacterized protein n=1 Tax=Cotesia glomerata TaxID=32391 RepID=A0AAV7I6E2_COTGL|nr:hypothetical protein KQX54_008393 [Cotesia glomerata]